MQDNEVEDLLDSDESLVLIEAPAGTGKTYQGANYARREASRLRRGRILILTHTHAACGVFADATKADTSRVEIKTIDSLIAQIAAAYHKTLDLPADPSAWARQERNGYTQLAERVSTLIANKPMVANVLADRFPVIIGDEHQDTSEHQHAIMLHIYDAGSKLRVFGDPMQQIYRSPGRNGFERDRERWREFRDRAAFGELETPHRWAEGSPALGAWVLEARSQLKNGQPIDLSEDLPDGLRVVRAENTAQTRTGFQLAAACRQPLDQLVAGTEELLILTDQNETAKALRAFWNRRIPIWEGYTRDSLGKLVTALTNDGITAEGACTALNTFIYGVSVGYTASSHGNRLTQEVRDGCVAASRGKPALLQEIGRELLNEPNHKGAAAALHRLDELRSDGTAGFNEIRIDYQNEWRDAVRVGQFEGPEEALAELHRRRSYARPKPPTKAISTIHKAKGLECEHAMLLPCDASRYRDTEYARSKLYVGLSRASSSLTLSICPNDPGPLFRF
tara:strand:- start:413 stop:1936 length:1524 start_codon:yes stop_codon:yes gene_type:complete